MTINCTPAVVFDLDGTLVDSAADVQRALNRTLASVELPPLEVEAVRLMIGGGPRLLVSRALHRLGVETGQYLLGKLTDLFHSEYLRQENTESRVYEGAEVCLQRLRDAGTRIGICSNKPDDLCHKLIDELDMSRYFDVIQGSCTGLPRKPDPAPLLKVITELGSVPAAALYVGDSETDVLTARAAGVEIVLVSYGYTAQPAADLGADKVYDCLADIAGPELTAIPA